MPVGGELLATVQAAMERCPGVPYREDGYNGRLRLEDFVHDGVAHLLFTKNLCVYKVDPLIACQQVSTLDMLSGWLFLVHWRAKGCSCSMEILQTILIAQPSLTQVSPS